jgi:hypothetical protein
MSHSLRHRCANSLGVTYRAHSCYGVPGFGLALGLDWGSLALPQERARHVPFALRHRCANSLGVTYQAHSCYRVPGFSLST